jgi:hypothetical protein
MLPESDGPGQRTIANYTLRLHNGKRLLGGDELVPAYATGDANPTALLAQCCAPSSPRTESPTFLLDVKRFYFHSANIP